MKIVADKHIPYINEYFADLGQLVLIPGQEISKDDVIDATLLLVRSITAVNQALLQDTAVQFVGTMTAGVDHIDTQWLANHHITWAHAKGANANAVAEYILSCLASLRCQGLLTAKNLTAGVIGVGHVGQRVAMLLDQLAFTVLLNDPPRAQREPAFHCTSLTNYYDLDLICLHTPLTMSGPFPTYHLINQTLLQQLKPGCVIINAGRGAVIDNCALRKANHVIACLDVWEHEPNIDLDLLNCVALATPHIAGYSNEAKRLATQMIRAQADAFLQQKAVISTKSNPTNYQLDSNWERIALQHFDPLQCTKQMRAQLNQAGSNVAQQFEQLRVQFPLRNAWLTVSTANQ